MGKRNDFFSLHFPFSFDATGRFVNPPLIQKLCFLLSLPDYFFFNLEKLHRAEVPISFGRRVVSPVCTFKSRNAPPPSLECASFLTDLQLITLQRFCVRCRSDLSITSPFFFFLRLIKKIKEEEKEKFRGGAHYPLTPQSETTRTWLPAYFLFS